MLIAVQKRWLSWDFAVNDGPRTVAEIDVSWWREQGVLRVQGADYRVYREGWMRGDFLLESAGSVLARAEKPSAFRRAFTIKYADTHYTLQAESAFRRAFELLSGGIKIGSVSPQGIFTRRALVDLPPDLPLPVRVFVIWLTVILWKRQAEAASG